MPPLSHLHVWVVGDLILDQYWIGESNRLSPEAPVPVIELNSDLALLGGAANVAKNLATLGIQTTLLGTIGTDEAGQQIQDLLRDQGINALLHVRDDVITPKKLRVLSKHQQLLRIDREEKKDFDRAYWSKVLPDWQSRAFSHLSPRPEAIILADYAKGMLSHPTYWIEWARQQGIPVYVDPKQADFSVYKHARFITPNLKEFEMAVRVHQNNPHLKIDTRSNEAITEAARALIQHHELEGLLITRSEAGLSLVTQDEVTHLPAFLKEIYDVTGAGDTVIALFTALSAGGFPFKEAAYWSNVGASVVVSKLGASVLTLEELEQAGQRHAEHSEEGRVLTEAALLSLVQEARQRGEKIVFTNGCFDILHAGHVQYLNEAKGLGHRLVVAINADESVSLLKGKGRPINPLARRMQVVAALRAVDWVVSFNESTPERLIERLDPDVMVKGGDYRDIESLPGARFVLSRGNVVKILSEQKSCSTSLTIERMLAGLLE